jgi:hypothetical protein
MKAIKGALRRALNALGYTVMRTSSYTALCAWRDAIQGKPNFPGGEAPPVGGDLATFKDWWLATRPINVPWNDALHFDDRVTCVTLYRTGSWQVQQFVVEPNTIVHDHVHPDVDSFECFIYGDISFRKNGEEITNTQLAAGANFGGQPYYFLETIRILPSDKHSGVFGPRGGVFLSFQKWAEGMTPTNIGNNWASDKELRNECI